MTPPQSAPAVGCRLISVGSALPPRSVSNLQLTEFLETSDEWISSRTGIQSRRVAEPETTLLDIAARAARAALRAADLPASGIDTIICSSSSPDQTFPSLACRLQAELGCPEGPAFDIQAACTGALYGVGLAQAMIGAHLSRRVLLVSAELFTRLVDWSDRSTAVLFGDGAGALVIGGPEEAGAEIVGLQLGADGGGGASLDTIPAPTGAPEGIPAYAAAPRALGRVIRMNGRDVFRFSTKVLEQVVRELATQADVHPEAIELIVPHQANSRILATAAGRLGLPLERFVLTVDHHGNTSSASIPLALAEAISQGRCQVGSLLCLVAFGAGLTWGGVLLRWGEVPVEIDDPAAAGDAGGAG